ncbi:hypothetical protein BJX76DRAFT_330649 [Aspergillus varians]
MSSLSTIDSTQYLTTTTTRNKPTNQPLIDQRTSHHNIYLSPSNCSIDSPPALLLLYWFQLFFASFKSTTLDFQSFRSSLSLSHSRRWYLPTISLSSLSFLFNYLRFSCISGVCIIVPGLSFFLFYFFIRLFSYHH